MPSLIIQTPRNAKFENEHGRYRSLVYLHESKLTAVQRQIRRSGLRSYEHDVQAAFYSICERQGSDIRLFDVGAHIGLFSCMTSAIFESFNPYILAFEPSHDTSTTAVNIRNTNNFKYDLVRKAVSNTTGEVKFYLSAVSEASNSLNANFREGSREITVPVTTIDEVVEQGACLPTIIKIDVETFEYAVILGGTRTLRQAKPIIFCELLNKSDKQLTQMALSSLEAIGYKFYQIRPEKNWKARTASEAIREISNVHRDWLLTTEKLDGDFYDKFGNWKSSIDLLDETANTLVPPGEALPTLAGEV